MARQLLAHLIASLIFTSLHPAFASDQTGAATVIDGKTIMINDIEFHLWGIDAPEHDQYCKKSDGKIYACGSAATIHLAKLINGKDVTCLDKGIAPTESYICESKEGCVQHEGECFIKGDNPDSPQTLLSKPSTLDTAATSAGGPLANGGATTAHRYTLNSSMVRDGRAIPYNNNTMYDIDVSRAKSMHVGLWRIGIIFILPSEFRIKKITQAPSLADWTAPKPASPATPSHASVAAPIESENSSRLASVGQASHGSNALGNTVHVSGYVRPDGTHVNGYNRHAPSRYGKCRIDCY